MTTPAGIATAALGQGGVSEERILETFEENLRVFYAGGMALSLHGPVLHSAYLYAYDENNLFQVQENYIRLVAVAREALGERRFIRPARNSVRVFVRAARKTLGPWPVTL
jgi:hypothetical protein